MPKIVIAIGCERFKCGRCEHKAISKGYMGRGEPYSGACCELYRRNLPATDERRTQCFADEGEFGRLEEIETGGIYEKNNLEV